MSRLLQDPGQLFESLGIIQQMRGLSQQGVAGISQHRFSAFNSDQLQPWLLL
ncbi:MAG: hypothetical protein ACN4GM_07940 [Gammaproteobacteria bacterium]